MGAGDGTSPLLMAIINGQFDMAMLLIERGAEPEHGRRRTTARRRCGPPSNTQWQPRTRFPQPQEMELQKATYLDVMQALLDKGADPNARIMTHPWYLVYTGCGNRNCGLADTSGSTAFWRAAYCTDVEAMKLLVAYGADPNIPTIAPQRLPRAPGGGGAPPGRGRRHHADRCEGPWRSTTRRSFRYGGPGAFADPRRGRRRVRRRLRRQRPSSRARTAGCAA